MENQNYNTEFPHRVVAKYRKVVIDEHVDQVIKNICLEMEKRYQINFLEIGTDEDHAHFLV